jgi:hypothetical protein
MIAVNLLFCSIRYSIAFYNVTVKANGENWKWNPIGNDLTLICGQVELLV